MRELAIQYLNTADNLKERLNKLKFEKECANGDEYFLINRRIDALKDEYYHVKAIGNYLLKTYSNKEGV